MVSSNKTDGNYVILLGFAVGSFTMSMILLFQKRIYWTRFETIVTILVIACVLAWIHSGAIYAVIFGIISESIVGTYLIIRTFKILKLNTTSLDIQSF